MTAPKVNPSAKPLLTRDDLPLDAIAEICRRWGVLEMAIDPSQTRPPPGPAFMPQDNPFLEIDLYLIADFGPGKRSWYFKKHHMDVVKDLYNLLDCHVWIEEKDLLEKHIASGAEWAQRQLESRDVIYTAG